MKRNPLWREIHSGKKIIIQVTYVIKDGKYRQKRSWFERFIHWYLQNVQYRYEYDNIRCLLAVQGSSTNALLQTVSPLFHQHTHLCSCAIVDACSLCSPSSTAILPCRAASTNALFLQTVSPLSKVLLCWVSSRPVMSWYTTIGSMV